MTSGPKSVNAQDYPRIATSCYAITQRTFALGALACDRQTTTKVGYSPLRGGSIAVGGLNETRHGLVKNKIV